MFCVRCGGGEKIMYKFLDKCDDNYFLELAKEARELRTAVRWKIDDTFLLARYRKFTNFSSNDWR